MYFTKHIKRYQDSDLRTGPNLVFSVYKCVKHFQNIFCNVIDTKLKMNTYLEGACSP